MTSRHVRPRSLRAAFLALLIVALGPASFVYEGHRASADQIEVTPARLPFGRCWQATAWTGKHVFMFGGWGGFPTNEIFRFDPSADQAVQMNARLPEPLRGAAAVWSGRYVYIFSGRIPGYSPPRFSDKILRYDPGTDTIQTLSTRLPWVTEQFNALWYNGVVYLIGQVFMGNVGSPKLTITKFDPATEQVTIMKTEIPRVDGPGQAAVTDGRYIYIFNINTSLEYDKNPVPPYYGGYDSDDNRIDRFDPINDTIVSMKSKLPHAWSISAAWNGETAMIFGGKQVGTETTGWYDTIVEFNPQTDSIKVMDTKLPTVREGTSAVWTGDRYYVIGGFGVENLSHSLDRWDPTTFQGNPDEIIKYIHWSSFDWLDEIVSYDPVPEAPPALVAAPTSVGSVTLTWAEPRATTYAGHIIGYKIFRRQGLGGYGLIATTSGEAPGFSDTGCPVASVCTYRVAAYNVAGDGQLSSESTAVGI